MLTLVIVLLLAVVTLLSWQTATHRRQLKDLQASFRERTPYLVDSAPGPLHSAWLELTKTANELIAETHAANAARAGQSDQLEATLGNLQEGVLALDDSNRITLVNHSLRQILPDTPIAVGQQIGSVIHSSGFLLFIEEVRSGKASTRVELEFAQKAGSIWIEATATMISPWTGESGRWVLCVLHDVTRQKRLENMRKDFVANVSHELRTPLSVIKGYVETLVDDHASLPAEDRERFLRTIQRHTERLHGILEDLLTLSRLESRTDPLRREPTDLVQLARQLAGDYQQRLARSGHTLLLRLESNLPLLAIDAGKITQVLENLLDNGIKYTPPRSTITLVSRLTAEEVEIRVSDNGPGIPAQDLPRIFERFYRVDKGRSRERGGTGLGLSIAKHIVQLHGGRIGAESEVGKGTTVFFTLPLSSPQDLPAPAN